MKLSAVLIVKNEDQKLERCLKSIVNLVDEIVIVDTGSSDNTLSIAKKYTSSIFHYKWTNNFSAARNYALSKSTGDYNLIIDADEYITTFDQDIILKFISSRQQLGIITLNNLVEKNGETFFYPDYITRLIPRGVFFTGRIHEQVNSQLTRVIVPIEVTHDGYFQRSKDKFNRNISLLLKEYELEPTNVYVLYQLAIEYYGQGDYQKAKMYYENCYNLITPQSPIFPQLVTSYISLCKETKNFDQGNKIILDQEQFLENYPDFYFEAAGFYLDFVLNDIDSNLDFLQLVETCYLSCLEIGDITNHSSLLGTGSFLAQYNLGVFYETTKEFAKASYYYSLASKQGYERASQHLKRL